MSTRPHLDTIVYAGPTISREAAQSVLPGAIVRDPIARGHLYRDRMLGGTVFLILDGVFRQHDAVSPREIIDVIADGALVFGASSMGALRAAECWPAGMRGVGSIYRLFRRGSLGSDDEVAVTFGAEPRRRASVALVNVRYALSRLVRLGTLTRREADELLIQAQALPFSERHWELLLRSVRRSDHAELLANLRRFDLKRLDAQRALRRVARLREQSPEQWDRPRSDRLVPSEMTRERPHDATAGADLGPLKRDVVTWLFVSGRYRRLLGETCGEFAERRKMPTRKRAEDVLREFFKRRQLFLAEDVQAWHVSWQLSAESLLDLTMARMANWPLLETAVLGQGNRARSLREALWTRLGFDGELDAEIFRWRALAEAWKLAEARALAPRALHRHLAEQDISHAHGFPAWQTLEQALDTVPELLAAIREYSERLALAKAVRELWFSRSSE